MQLTMFAHEPDDQRIENDQTSGASRNHIWTWIERGIQIATVICLALMVGALADLRTRVDNLAMSVRPNGIANAHENGENAQLPTATPAHTAQLNAADDAAEIKLSELAKLITRDEGYKDRPYLDTGGAVTIGVGRSLSTHGFSLDELYAIVPNVDHRKLLAEAEVEGGRVMIMTLAHAKQILPNPLTPDDVHLLLTNDLTEFVNAARQTFPQWSGIDDARKEAIVDTLYNLGLPHFKTFDHFIAAVKARDWNKAAKELLLSEAARENIVRYHRNSAVIRTGDPRYFDLDN